MKKIFAAVAISAGLMISAQANAGGSVGTGGGPKVEAATAAGTGYLAWLLAAFGL